MKLTLRVTLLSILLLLLGFTVAGLGLSSYWNARSAADDLSRQILEQTALRIDCQINELLLTANRQGDLHRRLLESGLFSSNDFSKLAPYWLEQMKVHSRLVRLSLAVEAEGEWCYVRRVHGQELAIGELRRNHQTGKLELREYHPEQYPRESFFCDLDQDAEDPRARPWYKAARSSGRQSWSETYVLSGVEGTADVPGVSCATPVRQGDGSLLGVLTASFSLDELCGFLEKLPVGRNGYAFVVEFRGDGSRRVIAHPDEQSLLRRVRADGQKSGQELVPPEQLADERVQTFLNALPAELNPTELQGIRRLHFEQNGVSYLGAYACLSSRETPDWLICTIMPEENVFEQVKRNNRISVFIGLCVLAVAVFVSLHVSAQVAGPLERLAQQTTAIGRLQLDARPGIRSVVLEVDRLAVAMEEMKAGLRSFRKYVPSDLVGSLLAAGREARRGGELRTMTIYWYVGFILEN
jgi:adenylate cyclase